MADDKVVRSDWEKRRSSVCKPCWELKYCPYGPLVETFPLLGPTRAEAIEHNKFLKKQLEARAYKGKLKREIEKEVKGFNKNKYPVSHKKSDEQKACSIFGHLCPVFFVNEPFTETRERRKLNRSISRVTMLKVVRRDNNQCQICGKLLKDNEIEFDHVIPISKGGHSGESNIRVTCLECNRNKSDKIVV